MKKWARDLKAWAAADDTIILCSYIDGVGINAEECGLDAVFSFLLEGDHHIEVCAVHFSAGWLQGLLEDYGTVFDMAVLQQEVLL